MIGLSTTIRCFLFITNSLVISLSAIWSIFTPYIISYFFFGLPVVSSIFLNTVPQAVELEYASVTYSGLL